MLLSFALDERGQPISFLTQKSKMEHNASFIKIAGSLYSQELD